MTGLERVERAFRDRRRAAALMPYMMAGYPTLADSPRIARACVEAGAELIELGVPYSDPLADGPVIHAAATAALAQGVGLDGALGVAEAVTAEVPPVLMCYANQVLARGVDRFTERLANAGVAGLIVPDLPPEEAGELREAAAARGLALVMLIAPTSNPERIARIAKAASGFLYAVSVLGTTGERPLEELRYREVVGAAREASELPVAVGFGVASAAHAALAVEAGADGVIVGTRLVRAAGEGGDPARRVGEALAEIAAGLTVASGASRSARL